MSKNLSSKYYQENKKHYNKSSKDFSKEKKEKSDNMIVNITNIF